MEGLFHISPKVHLQLGVVTDWWENFNVPVNKRSSSREGEHLGPNLHVKNGYLSHLRERGGREEKQHILLVLGSWWESVFGDVWRRKGNQYL